MRRQHYQSSKSQATPSSARKVGLKALYQRLFACYGPQGWWPGQGGFEMVAGAILTQTTSWKNVEKALNQLKAVGALNPAALRQLLLEEIARLIYPAGYYQAKAAKLKAFAQHLAAYGDDLSRLYQHPLPQLRQELLSIYGVGEETADSILLYDARKPVFVVDAYTRRIVQRLGLAPARDSYATFQALFVDNLPPEVDLFQEYHALFVRHAKETCRRKPRCATCCLADLCPTTSAQG